MSPDTRQPYPERPDRSISDWMLLRRKWSMLSVHPVNEVFDEIAASIEDTRLGSAPSMILLSSNPEGLRREMARTIPASAPDNPLHRMRNAELIAYPEGDTMPRPSIVRLFKYNIRRNAGGNPVEWDEFYLWAKMRNKTEVIELGHRRIWWSDESPAFSHITEEDVSEWDHDTAIQAARNILKESPVITPLGEEFTPPLTRLPF